MMINVRDFGATGTGTTDDAPPIQRALDAVDPNRGGTVLFPQGRYRIDAGLRCRYQGTVLEGEGMPGTSLDEAQGSSRIISAPGITALTFDFGQHGTLGMGVKRLHLRAADGAGAGNGILVTNIERMLFEDVTVSDYVAGYGLRFQAAGGGNCQYATLRNFGVGDCLIGIHAAATAPNGLQIFGGCFMGETSPRPGSVGLWFERGDTQKAFGTVVQGYETGVWIASPAVGQELHGVRFEYCNTAIRVGPTARFVSIFGGSFNNHLLGGSRNPNIGIFVEAGAQDTFIASPMAAMPKGTGSVASPLVDNGTRTVVLG